MKVIMSLLFVIGTIAQAKPLVIAHRGASGYLPEHTLEAKALAYGMGADYLEQDVVLSRDGVPVILHDIHIDTVTDVATRFPGRQRKDGRFYAIDFTLAEIKTLNVHERVDLKTQKSVFPTRFPQHKSLFSVPALAEEIELIQGLNKATQKQVGIYVEIKSPAWHRSEGQDITKIVHNLLTKYGYPGKQAHAFIQCFDPKTFLRLKNEFSSKIPRIQLIGENSWAEADTDFDQMRTVSGLKQIASYAHGIGPWIEHIYLGRDESGQIKASPLVKNAHSNGLKVHPYTFRSDALPKGLSKDELMDLLFKQEKVDGIFTDFTDVIVKHFDSQRMVPR